MKVLLSILVLLLNVQSTSAMGMLPRNERVEDMTETDTRINMFSSEQGYEDQQMLEENPSREEEIEEARAKDIKSKEIEIKKEQLPPPVERPQIH
jgi:hypothetical protein